MQRIMVNRQFQKLLLPVSLFIVGFYLIISYGTRGHAAIKKVHYPYLGPTVPRDSVGIDGLPAHPKLLLFNDSICEGRGDVTLMYIYSGATQRERRDLIRAKFSSHQIREKWNISVVFVMGLSATDGNHGLVPIDLIQEYHSHPDLIIGDFLDTYKNLSYKGLSAFNYITHYCKNARHVIKSDDDVIVNVKLIMTWLEGQYKGNTRTIYGHYHPTYPPFICPNIPKWCVNKEDYPREMHPRYMSGVGIVFTSDIISDLYKASLEIPIFYIDDIYITGLLGERLENKTIVDWAPSIPFFAKAHHCQDRNATRAMVFAHAHATNMETLRLCWDAFLSL